MGKGFAKKKKQMRVMQEQIGQLQEQMLNKEETGTAGGGLVTVKLNGRHEMTGIAIKPECVDTEDVEGLEDLIKAAYNDASNKLQNDMPAMPEGMPDLGDLSSLGF